MRSKGLIKSHVPLRLRRQDNGNFEWTENAETRKAELMAVRVACKAILQPTPCPKESERTIDSPGIPNRGCFHFCTRRREIDAVKTLRDVTFCNTLYVEIISYSQECATQMSM